MITATVIKQKRAHTYKLMQQILQQLPKIEENTPEEEKPLPSNVIILYLRK